MAVGYHDVMIKAGQLLPAFKERPYMQQYHIVRRLCLANCIVVRASTHTAQRHPQETNDQALAFLGIMRPILRPPEMNKRWVINMDQSPLWHALPPKRTLNLRGSRTIAIAGSGTTNKRFTATLAVSANGDKLKPMMIFAGTRDGRIATREFSASPYRDRACLICQSSGWQDETNLLQWIDLILVPYLQEKAQGAPAVLMLDAFAAHHTESVKERLEEIGVTLYQIPPGCTSLTQPIDVGLAKPVKDRYRAKWWAWYSGQNQDGPTFRTASRELCISWVVDIWETLPASIVQNSWRKDGLSYFPDEEVER